MSKKQRRTLVRLIIGAAAFAAALLIPLGGVFRLALFLVPYFVIGGDVLLRALRNIAHGQVFDENFLMAVATVAPSAWANIPKGSPSCSSTRWASSSRATRSGVRASRSPP